MAQYTSRSDKCDLLRAKKIETQETQGEGVVKDEPYMASTQHTPTTTDVSPARPLASESFANHASSTEHIPWPVPICSSCMGQKGILKKVRFTEERAPLEEASTPEQSQRNPLTHPSSPTHLMEPRMDCEISSSPNSRPLQSSLLPLPAPPPPPPPPPPSEAPRPPTLFNKAIETDEFLNAAAFRLYTNFIDELSEFVIQQGQVIAMRLAVQEKRKGLSRLREHVSSCDMMLFDCLRRQRINGNSLDERAIVNLFEASRAARDEIGPAESEYEPLEIMLGSKEQHLVETYSRIEGSFEHFFRLKTTPPTKTNKSSEIEYETSSMASVAEDIIPVHENEHVNGAIVGETVGVGQLPRYAVELDLIPPNRREFVVAYQKTSDLHKLHNIHSTDKGFGSGVFANALSCIGIWTTDRMDRSEVGTMPRESAKDESAFFASDFIDIPSKLQDSMADYPVNPGLEQDDPLRLLDESIETQAILSGYLVDFESTPDRINRWILHQLRVSSHEMYTLHRCITALTGRPYHGARSVLEQWPHDNLGRASSYDQALELREPPVHIGFHGARRPECGSLDVCPNNDS